MNITGHINIRYSTLQPLKATAITLAAGAFNLSNNVCIRLDVPDLPVLHSFRVKQFRLISDYYHFDHIYSGNTMLKELYRTAETIFFDTPFPSANYSNTQIAVEVIYEISQEDLSLLLYIASRTTAKLVNLGCKIISEPGNNLDYPSYIQNLGTENQLLNYIDCYGNSGTLTLKPGEATYFLVATVDSGSGNTLYQLYSK